MSSQFTVSIAPFRLSENGWKCSCFEPEEFVEALDVELAQCCRKEGLKVVEGRNAHVVIEGIILKVDEGNQALRYIFPGLGASKLDIKGKITPHGEEPEEFRQVQGGYIGLFGGNSKTLLQQALQRASRIIARDARDAVDPQNVREGGVLQFFLIAGVVAAILALLVGLGGMAWASGLPKNVHKPGDVIAWSLMMSACVFAATAAASVAFAPARILEDRAMLWLLTISGVGSLTGVRVILSLFAIIPLGFAAMLLALMAGPR